MRKVKSADRKGKLREYQNEVGPKELALAEEGKLRLGEGALPESFWSLLAPRVSHKRVAATMRAERDEE